MASKAARKDSAPPAAEPNQNSTRAGVWFERAGFVLLLIVLAARPMIQETHAAEQPGVLATLEPLGRVGPVITVVLDGVILAACGLMVLAGLRSGRPYRRMGVEWPILLVGAAALVSCTAASNKRMALTAATDWALLLLTGPALFQLLRTFRQARLVICVLLATAGTFAVQCVLQRAAEFGDTIEMYQQIREQFWQARGVELDAPEVTLFERRLQAREVSGYLAHSNVAGGYLAMCGLVGVGLAWSKLYGPGLPMRRGFGVVAAAITALIALPMVWTGSKGALAAAACGALLAVVLLAVRGLRKRPGRTLLVGWGLGALVAVGAAAWGTTRGTLPGSSLAFRWTYWTNSAKMIGDHWLRGVGMENFGRYYPRYKPVTSPETISDPHNLLVRAASEWGLVGGLGMLWLLVAGTQAMARPRPGPAAPLPLPINQEHMCPWIVGALVAVGIVAAKAAAGEFVSATYFFVSAVTPATTWLLLYALLIMDTNRLDGPADDPPVGLSIWLGGAGLAFVLHNMVSFSWFVAGVGTTFMAVFAVAVFLRNAVTKRATAPIPSVGLAPPATETLRPRRAAWGWALVFVAVAGLGHVVWNLVPVVRTDRALAEARAAVARSAGVGESKVDAAAVAEVAALYGRAVAAERLDPAAPAEGARRLAALVTEPSIEALRRLDDALAWAVLAQQRDPANGGHWRLEASLADRRFAMSRRVADARRAVAATRQAIERHPHEPLLYEALGDRLYRLWTASPSARTIVEAAEAYRRALDMDAARPPQEIRRFSPRKVEAIRRKIESCVGAADHCCKHLRVA